MDIDCIIPAAGFSSRMGGWKLILPYGTSTIIESSIKNALSFCSKVIVVTGYRGMEMENLVGKIPNTVVITNEDYHKGMFSSIQTGVSLVESDWFFVTMGDMPEIDESIYRKIVDKKNNTYGEFDIIRPVYKGKRGHPVLLHRKTIASISREPVDSEMRNVFSYHNVMELDMDLQNTFRDIDTPEEYQSIINSIQNQGE